MSYCINPSCPNFNDPSNPNERNCANCGPERLLQGRYRVIQPLGRGSFGQTFEVDDVRGATGRGGPRKVLKVLLTSYPQAVSRFQREARILSLLDHPGIPKVEPDGYFTFWPQDSQQPLHCLVMEKIEGINLKEWLRNQNNQPITPEQAIAWLKQLAEILIQIHLKQYLHRDIKPSNIMLQPNGQLVLIDFGAVREATETYLQKLQGRYGTAIISPGYTPPEQANGRAVLKSDFYALGRTFVHLLTGKHPLDLSKHPQTGELGELAWASSAPQVSQRLADLVDLLMAPLSENRPENAQEILHRLNEIERSKNESETRSILKGKTSRPLLMCQQSYQSDKRRQVISTTAAFRFTGKITTLGPVPIAWAFVRRRSLLLPRRTQTNTTLKGGREFSRSPHDTWRFSMITPKQTQMYAIRLKPGTYRPPMAAGTYVAHSALPSEIRFTSDIQTARTWGSYQEAYSYLDENLYGMAEVVTVVSMHRLLAAINRLGDNGAIVGIPQLAEVDKKLASTELAFEEAEASLHHQQPQPTLQHDRKVPLPQGTTSKSEGSYSLEPDDTLHLYHLYLKSELPLFSNEPLAEEWATVAEISEVNEELSRQGFIWVKTEWH